MSGAGGLPDTARRYDISTAANPPANPVQSISHLKPLPQSWRKKARGSAADRQSTANTDQSLVRQSVGPGALKDGIHSDQKPQSVPVSGAESSAEDSATSVSPHATITASGLEGGIGATVLPMQTAPALMMSSPKSSHTIKPYTPRGSVEATIIEPKVRSPAGVSFRDNLSVASISSSGQPVHGHRTFANSLSLIVEALSFNQMSFGSGFDAFDIDGDRRISMQDFQRSVDDLQLELDRHTIQLMHRCLDADDDGFIGKQEWITGLNAVQAGHDGQPRNTPPATERLAEVSRKDWADPQSALQVPLGLNPSAQAHMAFETVRGRLEAALQEKEITDGRMKSLGKLESKVISAEYAAAQIKVEIASAIHDLNTAIEFDLGRIADRERERQIQWEKESERIKAERDRELLERLSLKEQVDASRQEIAGLVQDRECWQKEKAALQEEITQLRNQDERAQAQFAEAERHLKEQRADLEEQLRNTKAELEAVRGEKSSKAREAIRVSKELEEEKKAHNDTRRTYAQLQHSYEVEQGRAKVNLDRSEKAEISLRELREELAVLKAARSATPSESDASILSEQVSHRSRASSKDARKGDKTDRTDRTDKSDRSEKRRVRRDRDAALEEAERLRGELATFKTCYHDLQKELQMVSGDLALLDTREEAVRGEVERKEEEVRQAHLEIEALEDQLYSLQAMREQDQREDKWAHGGVSKESHESVIKMLRDKEADIADLRLRLSIAEDGEKTHVPQEVVTAKGRGFGLHNGLLDFGVGVSSSHNTAWHSADNHARGQDAVAQFRLKQASDENRLLGTAFQNYKQESDSRLLRAQRLADEQRNSIDTLQRQNQYLAEEMKYKEEQISKQVHDISQLAARCKESQNQQALLMSQLDRLSQEKQQLEETIGVVAGVVTRSTPRGPGGSGFERM